MQKSEILNHFENEAREGIWDNLYNPNNPSNNVKDCCLQLISG